MSEQNSKSDVDEKIRDLVDQYIALYEAGMLHGNYAEHFHDAFIAALEG